VNRRQKFWIVAGVPIVLLLGCMAWTPVSIWCHKRALAAANEGLHAAMAAERSGGTGERHSSEWAERRKYHCERLVELGYFFHQSYEMDNLPDTDTVYYAIMDRWMREFPTSPYSVMAATDYVFDVYDLAESKPRWDAFVKRYNVADFSDRFVSNTTNGAEQTDEREVE
jgi:hypothetical protein